MTRWLRPLPLIAVLLTLAAIVSVILLGNHADASRREQLRAKELTLALADLQSAPFNADRQAGGSPAAARAAIAADERTLAGGLAPGSGLNTGGVLVGKARADLVRAEGAARQIFLIASSPAGLTGNRRIPVLQLRLTQSSEQLSAALARIDAEFADRADTARTEAEVGTAVAMLLLVSGFAFFYYRSRRARERAKRLAEENRRLLGESRLEATTDELTGLGNRRALMADLEDLEEAHAPAEALLAMFDLDGFKQYNDTFGHAAGDELLARFGNRLGDALGSSGSAYRMGGDEFCIVIGRPPEEVGAFLDGAIEALFEAGEGWSVGASYGAVWMPSEAASPDEALRLADRRMYANKAGRSSASRQLTDVLLQVLDEQSKDIDAHASKVADLAEAVARELGEPRHEVDRIRLAATLHDIGKAAIPATILDHPGSLDEAEWEFIRQHPLIGERIVAAAPALASTAPLIRASHERLDGRGYPDRLAGDRIPLGARIISVCDAFDAMTSTRPYREAVDDEEALTELRRCAGTQFDPEVVAALARLIEGRAAAVGERDLDPGSRRG